MNETKRIEWSKKTDEELVQMYANARTTSAGAGGHTKAELNEIRYRNLRILIEERGIEIISDHDCFKIGKFNGNGAV